MSEPTEPPYGEYDPSESHAFPDERLRDMLSILRDDEEVAALIEAQNVNPVTRLGFNDHGSKHVRIVRNRALALYDLLKRDGVTFNGARDHGLDEADEAVIIGLGATLHDVGHIVHRDQHSHWSVPIAADVLDRLLDGVYPLEERIPLKGEVLHTIICHHSDQKPLTREAGVVRIADALDMERGRSREPYESGGRGINTVSSQAIEQVHLYPGTDVAVQVEIEMTNAAGVYQVDELLKSKLDNSGLEEHIRIVGVNISTDGDRIVERIEL